MFHIYIYLIPPRKWLLFPHLQVVVDVVGIPVVHVEPRHRFHGHETRTTISVLRSSGPESDRPPSSTASSVESDVSDQNILPIPPLPPPPPLPPLSAAPLVTVDVLSERPPREIFKALKRSLNQYTDSVMECLKFRGDNQSGCQNRGRPNLSL